MAHIDGHKEFSSSVLKEICQKALESLPTIDTDLPWERKAELALEHLENKVVGFCGVEQRFGFLDRSLEIRGFPRFALLLYEVAEIIQFDVMNHHGSYTPFQKGEIISKYVVDAIGEKL
jgi:hypothetical protein